MPHILVLEDDANIRQLLEVILACEGWSVTAASTVDAAFRALAAQRPDLIVTDRKLHGKDGGVALIEESRRVYPSPTVPVILLSGSTTLLSALGAQVEAYPLVKFMSKPFNVAALVAQANQLLALQECA